MSNSKAAMWSQMIVSDTAGMFFGSFPDDTELAKHLNSLFPGDGEISVNQVARDRDRFMHLPRRGEEREDKVASPTKHVIRNKAQQLNVQEALAEIVDNIFDNFEREKDVSRQNVLNIELTLNPPLQGTDDSTSEIVVRENSGGIPNSRVVPLIQLGLSERAVGGIGAWGEGFKVAAFALGQEIEVFSLHSDDTPVCIAFPKGWLDPNSPKWREWKVSTYTILRNVPSSGSTVIRIGYLHEAVLSFFGFGSNGSNETIDNACANLARDFGEIYSEKYHNLADQGFDVNMQVTSGDVTKQVIFFDRVKSRLEASLAFLPWLRPIHWQKTFEVQLKDEGRKASLTLNLFAGLSATESYSPRYAGQQQSPGVEMWGNGRLFSLKSRITDESVGWEYVYGGSGGRNPASNSSSRRIMLVALFTSDDSRDIPWAAPVKNDYNRRNDFYAEMQEMIARAIRLYKDSTALLEFVLLPYSSSWATIDNTKKIDLLFNSTDGNQEVIQNFVLSRFGQKLLNFEILHRFKEVDGAEVSPTVKSLFGVEAALIQKIVQAAVTTKQSSTQRIEFLKEIFPSLSKTAELEEEVGVQSLEVGETIE